jgi:hypothetical protein
MLATLITPAASGLHADDMIDLRLIILLQSRRQTSMFV